MKIQLDKFLQIVVCFCFVVGLCSIPMKAEAEKFIWPCAGSVTSPYGWRWHPIYGTWKLHKGIDISANIGDPVVASLSGTVLEIKYEANGYGRYVVLSHPNGYDTLYAHNSSIEVAVGQAVRQGQLIALAGNSGGSTGPHCHFEIYPNHGTIPDNPAKYLEGAPPGSMTPALDSARAKWKWDKEHDFSKPIYKDIIEPIVKLVVDSWDRIKDVISKLLMIILTIDLALAASLYTINPNANNQQYGIFGFLINKLLVYSILIWLVSSWGGTINNLMRDFSTHSAAIALSKDNAEICKFMQDPFDILTKGIHLVSPFFESAVMLSLNDPISLLMFFVMVIMGAILILIFFFISYNIVMAYLGFYFSALFGFGLVFLAGFKHTRHHAEQGINGIFYATIKLFVFSFAGFIILGLMKDIAVDKFIKQEITNTSIVVPTDGNFGGEEGLTVVAELIKLRESGGDYEVYNVDVAKGDWSLRHTPTQGDGGYGAWQFTFDNYERWGKEYEKAGGSLDRIEAGNDPKNSPNKLNGTPLPYTPGWVLKGSPSGFSYCPENQRKIAEFILLKRYREFGNWKDVIASWNPNDKDYYNKVISGATGTNYRRQASVVVDFMIVFKLFVTALIFVYLFSKLNKTLESLLGGNGFRFTVRDFE